MSGFTPGPWHRNIKPASKYPVVWAGRNTHVAVIANGARHGHGGSMSEEEQEANINLIAAAPEQNDALCHSLLNELLGLIEDGTDERAWTIAKLWMDVRDAALAKAEGRS